MAQETDRSRETSTPDTVDPSDEQLALNDEGVEALVEENYARAVALFEQALLLGELNVTYLNLGRAYQKMGKCEKAEQALARVKSSPKVDNPPANLVASKADEYLAEVQQICETDDSPLAGSSETPPASTSPNVWGWTATAAGLVIAGTGVGLHFAAEGKRDSVRDASTRNGLITSVSQSEAQNIEDEANTLDTAGAAMMVTGVIGAGVGTYLLLSASEEAETSVAVQFTLHSAGLSFSKQF